MIWRIPRWWRNQKPRVRDHTKILEPYKGRWVVISNDDEVVGSGDTTEEAEREAMKKSCSGVLYFVPQEWLPMI